MRFFRPCVIDMMCPTRGTRCIIPYEMKFSMRNKVQHTGCSLECLGGKVQSEFSEFAMVPTNLPYEIKKFGMYF